MIHEVQEGRPHVLPNAEMTVRSNTWGASVTGQTHYHPVAPVQQFRNADTGQAEKIVYAPGLGYKLIKRKDGFAKLEKMDSADYKAQAKQAPAPAQWSEAASAAQTKSTNETLRKARETLARLEREKQAKVDRSNAPLKEALSKLAKQAGGMTMGGSWTPTNPALDKIKRELQRDGDPRSAEQFIRDLVSGADKDAAAKAREVRAAQQKLMRQVSGARD